MFGNYGFIYLFDNFYDKRNSHFFCFVLFLDKTFTILCAQKNQFSLKTEKCT